MNHPGMCRATTPGDLRPWACRSPLGQNVHMTGRRGAIALVAPALLLGLMVAPAASTASAAEAAPDPRSAPLPPEGTTDQLIVTTMPGVSDGALEQATEGAAADLGAQVTADVTREITATTSVVRLDEALPLDEAAQLAADLSSLGEVRRAEPDVIMRPATSLPNDPYAPDLWGLWQTSPANGGFSSRALPAWTTTQGAGVTVAVLDTGIASHPDLDANVVPGYDFISYTSISNDGDGRDPDASDPGDYDPPDEPTSSWHGTHVAGTIAAIANNSLGVAGVAPQAKVQSVRVLGAGGGYTSDIADGIRWAAGATVSGVPNNPTPAKVINMSLGGSGFCYPSMQSAINVAVGLGSVVVVAAGNSAADAVNFSPASCSNVITVASHTSAGAKSWFSNYGSYVELSGPGSGIISTLNSGSTTPVGPSYANYSGTSMATPHVAGVAALALSADSTLTPAEITSLLQATAQPFAAGSSCISLCGAGYVDAAAAIASIGSLEPLGVNVTADYEALNVAWTVPTRGVPTHYDVEVSTDGTTWTADDSVTSTSTTLTGLNPADTYTVRVRTVTADDSSAWVTSTPTQPLARTVPDAVTALATVVDDSALQVSWAAPAITGGHPIDYYTVEYSTDDSTWVADDTVTATSTTVDGLVNGTGYKVRVSAVNTLGPGPVTTSAYATPRSLTVPSAPQGFTLVPEDGGIALTWSTPADDGGRAIDGYYLEYSADGTAWTSIGGSYLGYAITLLGLNNGTTYTVRVAAHNAIGTGPWATETATPVGPPPPPPPPPAPAPAPAPPPPPPAPVITAPGAPVITDVGASDRTVMALWQASDDTGGEEPSEFVVELAGPEGTQTRTTPITYEEFGDLVNGTAYRVRVAATNSAGTGDFSAWSDEVTPIGLAAAPTGLTGTAFDGGVDLQWVAPDDTGGAPIEDYVVTWVSDGIEVALTTEETSIRLETLANGTRYAFRVAAQTEAGVGPWSTVLSLTPRAEPVTAPEGVIAERTGRRLVVTWSAPTIGEPKRYVVAASMNGGPYRIKRSTDGTRVTLSLSKRTATIAVRILAIDSYGRGPWSEPTQTRIKTRR